MKTVTGVTGLALSLGLMGTAGAASAGETCDRIAATFPGSACVETAHGAAVAPDTARATQMAGYAAEGERRFETHFGRPVGPYVVYEFTDKGTVGQTSAALRAVGVDRALPQPTLQAQKEMRIKALQEGAVPQMRAAGRTEAMIEQAVATRMAAMDTDISVREASVLPHELSHQWYVQAGWPTAHSDAGGHYGGPGPDWMDEMAAILGESDVNADGRRQQFRQLYQNSMPTMTVGLRSADLVDLSPLLDQVHPAHARDRAADRPRTEGVATTIRASATGAIDPVNLFYLRVRMFADFLMARTNDPAVFGSILDAFSRGDSFDQWLATEGQARGLAPDRAGLEQQWRAWLGSSLGELRIA
ncbi:hypothetical protein [Brevundimonas goettingensis]|uniref:Peptidase M1 membrane alanine aminopeptidase domain-containing protein n=1 Tax=Brevundimonas goettingensis TaxID=2774190 RepID=A0A975C2I7_9CAUL|nr:hypothetical protein [Brevundimonas goettingensis]QTC92688.1 hypothetical protein IFJ75_07455 [Brevundimonas goettingensis]